MLSLGIVGLPNVGKSSLFKALTRMSVPIANYPFTTIEPHHGVVAVPDDRLQKLSKLTPSNQVFPTAIEFVDIAGLIPGAHKGEGLGNQFLSHIREVSGVLQVVRLFEDKTVPHPIESIDPERDIKIIDEELAQADLKILERALEESRRLLHIGKKELTDKIATIQKVTTALKSGLPVRDLLLNQTEKAHLKEYNLLTAKPIIFAWNVNEAGAPQLKDKLSARQGIALPLKLLADFADLPENELATIKKEFGVSEDLIAGLIRKAYQALGLITFFTVKPPETRAWAVRSSTTLPEAGATIHTDFKDKFIRAEVINISELLKFESWQNAKLAGKIRIEGREYLVQDGDVIEFKI